MSRVVRGRSLVRCMVVVVVVVVVVMMIVWRAFGVSGVV